MERKVADEVNVDNPYNEDEVKGYRKGKEYWFKHVPTGTVSKTHTVMRSIEEMETDHDYYQLEAELFSGRLHLFLQNLFGI